MISHKGEFMEFNKMIKSPDLIHKEDFGKDKKAAEEWVTAHRERLERDLTLVQKDAIKELHIPNEVGGINKLLRETGGNLENLPREDLEGNPDLQLIERINHYKDLRENLLETFKHLSTKIPGRMYVYKELSGSDFGYKNQNFLNSNDSSKIDIETASNFERIHIFGLTKEFLPVTAAYSETHENLESRIQLKLELSRGTNILPVGSSDILYLEPGEIEITDMSIIILKNLEYLRINARYVPEEDSDKIDEIADSQLLENIKWNMALNLPDNYKLFEFKLSGLFASGVLENAIKTLDNILKIDNPYFYTFLFNITKYIKEFDGKIILTDQPLGSISQLLYDEPLSENKINHYNRITGVTKLIKRYIGINGYKNRAYFNDEEKIQKTIIYEFSHMQDRRLGQLIYQENDAYFTDFNDKENGFFQNVYQSEIKNLTEPIFNYLHKNEQEYLAEVHAFMYSNQIYRGESEPGLPNITGKTVSEIIRLRAPKTVAWIEEHFYK